MFGAEQRHEPHARSRSQNLSSAPCGTVATGIVGQKADAQARKLRETAGSKNIDAELHLGGLGLLGGHWRCSTLLCRCAAWQHRAGDRGGERRENGVQ
jgi:hypothetical protein